MKKAHEEYLKIAISLSYKSRESGFSLEPHLCFPTDFPSSDGSGGFDGKKYNDGYHWMCIKW